MKLKLNFSDGTYSYSSFVTKRKIGPSSTIFKDKVGNFEGTARITYSQGGYNEFEFSSKDDFIKKASPAMEAYLDVEF